MECNIPFSLLEPHHCELTGKTFTDSHSASTPTQGAKRPRKEKTQKEREKRPRRDATYEESAVDMPSVSTPGVNETVPTDSSVNGYSVKEEATANDGKFQYMAYSSERHFNRGKFDNCFVVETGEVPAAEVSSTAELAKPEEIVDKSDVLILQGHQSEVFSCSWNPVEPLLLASGYVRVMLRDLCVCRLIRRLMQIWRRDCSSVACTGRQGHRTSTYCLEPSTIFERE